MSNTKTRRRSGLSITIAIFLVCSVLTAMTWCLPAAEAEPSFPDTSTQGSSREQALPSKSDPLLLLVNRAQALPEGYAVTTVPLEDGSQTVAAAAYTDLCAMLAAGAAEGLDFIVCSGYRSTDTQAALFNEDMQKYIDSGLSYTDAYKETAAFTMPPSHSEHETGLAVDIVARENQLLDHTQAQTAETQWLHAHCWEYGFILRYPEDKVGITGISYEPWHYRYVGREAAAYLTAHGLTLEEFHAQQK